MRSRVSDGNNNVSAVTLEEGGELQKVNRIQNLSTSERLKENKRLNDRQRDEVTAKLAQIRTKEQAEEVNRFLLSNFEKATPEDKNAIVALKREINLIIHGN